MASQEELHEHMLEVVRQDDYHSILALLQAGYEVPHEQDIDRWGSSTPIDYTLAYIVFFEMIRNVNASLEEVEATTAELCRHVNVWEEVNAHGNDDLISVYGQFPLLHSVNNKLSLGAVFRGMEKAGVSILYPKFSFLKWYCYDLPMRNVSAQIINDMKRLIEVGYDLDDDSEKEYDFDSLRGSPRTILEQSGASGLQILYTLGEPCYIRIKGERWNLKKQVVGTV